MDKPHARIIDRDEAVREMIELAISLYLNDRSWASAITLARAAQQYLHEKLRTLGKEPTLAIMHNQIRDVEGIEISFSDFRDHQTGYANLLKHSRDANEPSTLTIKANRVERGIELAVADYNQAFGEVSPAMLSFVSARLTWNTGAGARLAAEHLENEWEELRSIAQRANDKRKSNSPRTKGP